MTGPAAAIGRPGAHPDLPPPLATVGWLGWLRRNLFSSPFNTALTLATLVLLYLIVPPLVDWALISAYWGEGTSRNDCLTESEGLKLKEGACWTMIRARFGQFLYFRYPAPERWRVDVALLVLFGALVPLLTERVPGKRYLAVFLFAVYPPLAVWLFYGGLGLAEVETPLWGGLMLTVILGTVGIVFSLPIGIVLALGRRSQLPAIRLVCVAFIEFVRAVPFITVLFMASVMLPLFLPDGVSFDKLLRAMIAIALFGAAYMAEVVRGGLQAIPRGQYEAAMAIGLNYWKSTAFIVLPQALRIVIPGIVNTFIGLFKDTTLVLIIGLFDLLNTVLASTRDADWAGLSQEGYVFAACVYFTFCFGMSRYSQYLEQKLHTGHRR